MISESVILTSQDLLLHQLKFNSEITCVLALVSTKMREYFIPKGSAHDICFITLSAVQLLEAIRQFGAQGEAIFHWIARANQNFYLVQLDSDYLYFVSVTMHVW